VVSGSLPPGLNLDAGSGKISGVPGAAGTFTPFFEVSDSSGANSVQSIPLMITNPSASVTPSASLNTLAITTGSMPSGTVGTQYSQPLQYSNGTAPFTWSIYRGSLPAGLYLDARLGIIFGNPSGAGNFYALLQLTDSSGASVTQPVSIVINNK
jgi:hypothetical protein